MKFVQEEALSHTNLICEGNKDTGRSSLQVQRLDPFRAERLTRDLPSQRGSHSSIPLKTCNHNELYRRPFAEQRRVPAHTPHKTRILPSSRDLMMKMEIAVSETSICSSTWLQSDSGKFKTIFPRFEILWMHKSHYGGNFVMRAASRKC